MEKDIKTCTNRTFTTMTVFDGHQKGRPAGKNCSRSNGVSKRIL